jgi:hypothetical protein
MEYRPDSTEGSLLPCSRTVFCPQLGGLRQKLRENIGGNFKNISLMLGGKQQFMLKAGLDFAEAAG